MDQMDQWLTFVKDKWIIILIAIVLLFVVINVVKTVLKWGLVLVIIAAVVFYGVNYTDEIKEVGGQIADYAKEEAFQAMLGEAQNAKYSENPDGTFTITSDHIQIQGTKGSDEVKISFNGYSYTFKINGAIRAYIDGARQQ